MDTPDPTSAPDVALGQPLASDPSKVIAAGYSWASLVLQGAAPPPLGFHLATTQDGRTELKQAQQAAAVRMYATLSMQGDAMGMLGMSRLLLQTAANLKADGEGGGEERKKAVERAIALLQASSKKGISEAYYELGVLHLSGELMPANQRKAFELFELAAADGNARAHHALGVLLSRTALDLSTSPSVRQSDLTRSYHHFTSAAEQGDAQSAHNLGLRYLLREEMVRESAPEDQPEVPDGPEGEEILNNLAQDILKKASRKHQELYGVEADDRLARQWFEKATEYGSVPASLNLAGLLVEARGAPESLASSANANPTETRLAELKKAYALYSRVAALGQQAAAASPSNTNGNAGQAQAQAGAGSAPGGELQEMTTFATQAASTVENLIKEILEPTRKAGDEPHT
ncbi:Extracellular protein SEL-1 and related proteins [Ceraceosorus bombacis]|uniref:Extracellular protein SEL-1 and related proteins n=1 Tax=Ceraceosorus bombacis TaxID=401625 RepID=A0A0N7LA75_9BASI|nr:Extracellular protein SEL-1 and related proteins [Ceraceosorus bombacis]